MSKPTRKTDEEIRERIAAQEAALKSEKNPGMRIIKALLKEELKWVLGE